MSDSLHKTPEPTETAVPENEPRNVSDKARHLLKVLVEKYIQEGQPVGSKSLVESIELKISPATARNIMSDLEERGLIHSPHTSSGRVPTELGYRFFVDSLISVGHLRERELNQLGVRLDPDLDSTQLVQAASAMLSEVTSMAGLVTLPRRDLVMLKHVEFLPLSGTRVLVILVLDDHDVQNRVIHTKEPFSEVQLREATDFLNAHFSGHSVQHIRQQLITSMRGDRESMNALMVRALDVAEQALSSEDGSGDFVMAGQENLFELAQEEAMEDVRDLFRLFSLKGDILHLLDKCLDSAGVQLFIGQESGYEPLDSCTVVTSPYQVDGELVGVVGVIGPTRMAYERVIPVVDGTARLLSAAMDVTTR